MNFVLDQDLNQVDWHDQVLVDCDLIEVVEDYQHLLVLEEAVCVQRVSVPEFLPHQVLDVAVKILLCELLQFEQVDSVFVPVDRHHLIDE